MYQEFFNQLNADTIVLTVNNRLARYLLQQYADWKQANGQSVYDTPTILPIKSWLRSCWQSNPRMTLLNEHQSNQLWESIITQSEFGSALLRIEETAYQVAAAWELVQYWEIDINELQQAASEDVQVFANWATTYQQSCLENNWVDSAQLPALLTNDPSQIPPHIYLAGFDNIPPIINKLIDNIKQYSNIEVLDLTKIMSSQSLSKNSQTETELEQMAQWAWNQYQHSNDTIACIIPDLINHRAKIHRILQRYFKESTTFNISAAIPLSEYPLVNCALRIIQFACGDYRWQHYSYLLRSPFTTGSLTESQSRAELDKRLRDFGELELPPNIVSEFSRKCPLFAQILQQLPSISEQQSIWQWRDTFEKILQSFGWPGERQLDQKEYQIYQRFLNCLDEFSTINLIRPELTQVEAEQQFKQIVTNTLFQPKSTTSRVQILGLLEAKGQFFDKMWIQGLNDETLPAALSPNPYLPVKLQRERCCPHANPEHEWQYAQKIFNDLLHSAKTIVLSYASHDGDRELAPSPLLNPLDIPTFEPATPSLPQPTPTLETITDNYAPATQEKSFKGGSYLFKAQAMCPFKAFAEIRLSADTLNEPSQGLAPSERGEIIHEILANIWSKLKTPAGLIKIDDTWLTKEINHVLTQWVQRRPMTVSPEFKKIESKRLLHLIKQWLAVEQQRPPFKVIACEQKQTITLNGIELNLRIDRIDELPDGERLIIDYKTGNVSISNWSGDRPNDPQLLLYCVTSPDTQGIAFAQIRPNKMEFKGLTQAQNALPKVKASSDWEAQVSEWRDNLFAISDEFLAGYAAVDPQFGPYTCQYCQLAPLCRIHQERPYE